MLSGNGKTINIMDIISIDASIFNSLLSELKSLAAEAQNISNSEDYRLQKWLDNQDVCQILNVSKRTLQNYRDNGTLPFTMIDRKAYYKPVDVELILQHSLKNNKDE